MGFGVSWAVVAQQQRRRCGGGGDRRCGDAWGPLLLRGRASDNNGGEASVPLNAAGLLLPV